VTGVPRVAARQSVRRAVLNRVRRTAVTHQRVVRVRHDHPVPPPELHDEWRSLLSRTHPLVADGLFDLLADVFATPPAACGTAPRRNSRQLLPSDLKRLHANAERYVCHRTDREDVGTCHAPVSADERPFGVTAAIGLRGVAERGRFGVVFTRYGNHLWTAGKGSAVLCEVPALWPEEAVGWYVGKDLDEVVKT
jgi:hypothetical protein